MDQAEDVDQSVGVDAEYYNTIGDWGGHTEHSLMTQFKNIDRETLHYVMAKCGVLNGQAGTLAFYADPEGEHAMISVKGFDSVESAQMHFDLLAGEFASADKTGKMVPMQALKERSIIQQKEGW